jgi:hypothetical protein
MKVSTQQETPVLNLETMQWVVARSSAASLTAGGRGSKAGREFEDRFEDVLKSHLIPYEKQPRYTDYKGTSNRKGDFRVALDDTPYWLELKQLSDFGSHTDKLDHHFCNAEAGCYGDHVIILIDHHNLLSLGIKGRRKLTNIQVDADKWIERCARKGVTLRYMHIDEFVDMIEGL